MTNVSRRRAAVVLAIVLAACPGGDDGGGGVTATDTRADDASTTAGEEEGSAESGTGTDGGGPCGAGICAQSPPEGWFGPLVRFDNDGTQMPPACGDDWPDAAFTLLGGYADPGPAQCGACTCRVDVDGLCTLTGYRTEGSDVCEFSDPFQLASADTCYEHALADGSLWLYAFTDISPSCVGDFMAEIPEPSWSLEVTGCRGPEPGEACDDAGRQCLPPVPDGFSRYLCIFANGDLECPAGDYGEKTVLYSGVDDTRTCGTCMCGEEPEGFCTGEFEIFGSDDCSGAALQTAPHDGGCAGAVSGVGSLRFAYDGPATCDVLQMPAAAGSIAPAGEITYCCTPDPGT